jgi:hypothetical protein
MRNLVVLVGAAWLASFGLAEAQLQSDYPGVQPPLEGMATCQFGHLANHMPDFACRAVQDGMASFGFADADVGSLQMIPRCAQIVAPVMGGNILESVKFCRNMWNAETKYRDYYYIR